ncbi:MAG: RluA family pseudouridine synthase [Clostridia bacterium]|nr:RluA family pseudouridine synthase [Clostridia bacterium]
MLEIVIRKNDAGQRLDKFLLKSFSNLPPSLMYKAIRQKKIKRNRARAEQNALLEEGDVLQIFLPEEFFVKEAAKDAFMRLTPELAVLYEDENVLVVEKKPGMPVHPDEKQETGTLIDHIKAYLYDKGAYDPSAEQSFSPALCNRIDRNTGGIVLAAKNAEALRAMNAAIKAGALDKRYLCAAHGVFEKKSDLLTGWLVKDSAKNTVTVFDEAPRGAGREVKEIRTGYRVLSASKELSLLEIRLYTGRTHQIRAHLAHIGHPLLGDGKYGRNGDQKRYGVYCQALCAYRLTFHTGGDPVLGGLDGKTVSVPLEHVDFLKFFPDFHGENG